MRILIESKKVLVVETPGRIVLAIYAVFVALHAFYLFMGPAQSLTSANIAIIAVSALAYGLGAYLALGPMADKVTVTFHGAKHMVVIERKWPFDKKQSQQFSFDDFTQFEISEPEDKGFCRLRLKNDKSVLLFRIGKNDDYEVLKHLDMITRKRVEMIR